MIGLVIGGSEWVVSHIDPHRLGIAQEVKIKKGVFNALKG